MKLKYNFLARDIMGEYVLVPVGEAALAFAGMITTSEVGAFLVEHLKEEVTREELLMKLMETYAVEPAEAQADLDVFLQQLDQLNLLEK